MTTLRAYSDMGLVVFEPSDIVPHDKLYAIATGYLQTRQVYGLRPIRYLRPNDKRVTQHIIDGKNITINWDGF